MTTSADKLARAYELGANGGTVGDDERLAFEEWMRGHCWKLCATWTGSQYRGDAEQTGWPDPQAMMTRRLWAAWRDRAALAAHEAEKAKPFLTSAIPDLVDPEDGENRAVRAFLMVYGTTPSATTATMQRHMELSGYPYWPAWVQEPGARGHLTKGGAQNWIRHLIGLETKPEADALDAQKWRAYKSRKDALLAAGMGRNPLRNNEVCGNCDSELPKGCGGLFLSDGAACKFKVQAGEVKP